MSDEQLKTSISQGHSAACLKSVTLIEGIGVCGPTSIKVMHYFLSFELSFYLHVKFRMCQASHD